MSRSIRLGATDQSTVIRIVDSGDGTPEEGVEHNTSGIALWYRREGGTKATITPAALAALDSAHSDGGIEHIDDGYYRLDLPDAAVASGATGVAIGGVVTGMVVIGAYHPLVAYDPQDAVRLGLTALPNAAADAAGGLPISDAGGLDMDAILADTADMQPRVVAIEIDTSTTLQAELDGIQADTEDIQSRLPAALVGGRIDATIDATGLESGAAAVIADAVWDETSAGHTDAGKAGEQLWTDIDAILVDTGTTLQAELDGIQADTEDIQSRLPAALVSGRIDASVGAVAADAITAAAIANGAIDAATFASDVDAEILSYLVDDATRIDASALNTATGTTIPAILDDTDLIDDATSGLAKIATDVAAVLVDTAEIGAAGAGLTEAGGTGDHLTALATAAALVTVDGVVDAIKVTTDKLDDTLEDDAGVFRFTANALEESPAGSAPTAGEIADAVLDEALSGHTTAGTAGKALADAASQTTAASIRTAVGLGSANLDTQLDALPTAAENAAALLDTSSAVDGYTPRQALRLTLAALAGKVSGADAGTPVFRDASDTKNRISATTDADGNRTAVTLDAT